MISRLVRLVKIEFILLQIFCYIGREEYPTLLHFAARYGLEKLSWQLLECPGGEQASQIRNSCQLTPSDMAERAGHARLANTLKGFLVRYFILILNSGFKLIGFQVQFILAKPKKEIHDTASEWKVLETFKCFLIEKYK